MSELKDYSILDIEAIDDERFKTESAPGKWVPESRVYLKSEADKVIAELEDKLRHYPMMVALIESDKKEIAELKDKLQAADTQIENLINSASSIMLFQDRVNDDTCAELRHQKYKRGLAMAECRDAQARLFHRFGTEIMLHQLYGRNPAVDMKRMDRRSSRCRLASQLWQKRAEEFKEAK